MSNDSLLSSYFYESPEPNGELVSYAASFDTKIKRFGFAIRTLNKMGYDVLAFDYDPAVLRDGQPQHLIDVVAQAVDKVGQDAPKYERVVSMGVSLGGFIGYNVLKKTDNAYVGAFADCGVDFAPAMFKAGTLADVATAFRNNGYDESRLNQIWEPLDVEPSKATFPKDKSFIVYDGTRDKMINFDEAKANVDSWAKQGLRVKQYPVKGSGHLATAVYFVSHTKRIIEEAHQHHLATS